MGQQSGQFLILGSASYVLLRQTSESLAGRISYLELAGINALEIPHSELWKLWVRGGFPESFLADNDQASVKWRNDLITSYLFRDIPSMGPRIPAAGLRLLWTMLAHNLGEQVNFSKLAAGLDISVPTVTRHIEMLEDLFLVRTLRPWSGNLKKRLVKSPKVYIRDTGLAHALLNLTTKDDVLGHPIVGASWEAFVIENLLAVLPLTCTAWFYRTATGNEIDLVIEQAYTKRMAIEIKKSLAPTVSKGFHISCEDIEAEYRYVVYTGMSGTRRKGTERWR